MDEGDNLYRKIISGDIVNSNVNLRILGTVNGFFYPSSELVGVDDPQELYNKIITDDSNLVAAQYLHSPGGLVNVSTTTPVSGQALVAISGTEAQWQNISNIGFIDMQSGGLKSGGKITATSGLNISVAAGSGYVFDVSEDAVTWTTLVVTLANDVLSYVYVDALGVITSSTTAPDITAVVFLGTVYTSGGVVQVINQVPIDDSHLAQRVEDVFVETIGAIVINGIQASAIGLTVDVSAGSYGAGRYIYNPGAVTNVTFRAFWLSSSTIWSSVSTTTIDTANYNNVGTFTLSPMTAGKYAKHDFLTLGEGADQQYILIYGQGEYNTLNDAAASVNSLPPFCPREVPRLACFVFQANDSSVTVIDARPLFPPVGGSGSSTVTPHAATHLPSGTDPLTTSIAVGLTSSSTNTEGTANAFARSDHTHGIDITGFNLNSLTGTLGIAKGGTNLTSVTNGFFVSGVAGAYAFAKAVPGGTVVGTTDAQSLTNKTFLDIVTITPTTNQLRLGTGTTVTITAPTPAANNTYTIPDVGTTATFVMTAGTQTIAGTKTFSGTVSIATLNVTTTFTAPAIAVTNTTNQIVLGAGTTMTITAPTPASAAVYTIPDVGTTAAFVMTTGAQTISGTKTFSTAVATTLNATNVNTTNLASTGGSIVFNTLTTTTVTATIAASNSVYTIPDVGTTGAFVMTTGAQTISGTKTFSTINATTFNVTTLNVTNLSTAAITATNTTNQITLGTGTTIIITAPTPVSNSTYTIPDVGTTAAFVMSAGAQTIAGAKTFSSAVAITPTTNQIVLGTGTTTTINAAAPAVSSTYTIPDVGTSAAFVMTAGAQTIGGAKTFSNTLNGAAATFSGTITASNLVAVNTTNQITLGTGTTIIITAPSPIANSVYTIPDVGITAAFVMTAGAQTIGGAKTLTAALSGTSATFSGAITTSNLVAVNTTNQITLGTGTTTTISAAAPAANSTYTIPDVGTTAAFVMSAGAQTVGGAKTFSSAIAITPTTNQITLGTGTTTTISAVAPAVSSTYSIPDVGTTAAFVMTAGAQTVGGVKTFSARPVMSAGATMTDISITNTSDQLTIGTGTLTTITVPTATSARRYTISDVGADATFVMTAGTQTIGGAKTFSATMTAAAINAAAISGTTGTFSSTISGTTVTATAAASQIILRTTNTLTISAPTMGAALVYTLPDVNSNANFVMSAGAQTIGGAKTFSSAITITPTTNQITLGTGTTTTINAAAPAANSIYTVPDVGTTAAFVMTAGTQTIAGNKTFSGTVSIAALSVSTITLSATSNQLVLGAGTTITVSAPTPAVNSTYTIPDVGTTAAFVMTAGTQTVGGTKTFSSTLNGAAAVFSSTVTGTVLRTTSSQVAFVGVNTVTVAAAASAAPRTYTVPDVSVDADFVMAAGTQTIGGAKTFTTSISTNGLTGTTASFSSTVSTLSLQVTSGTNQITLGTTNTTTLTTATVAASRVYTIPEVLANADFVMTAGNQTIGGGKTFSGSVSIASLSLVTIVATATSNQITLGTGTTVTITAPTPAVNNTYTIPDVGATAAFVMTAGAQTVGGAKTFTSQIVTIKLTASNTSNQLVLGGANNTTINAVVPAASSVYNIPDVGTAADFVMTAGAQTIAGAKTFSSALAAASVSAATLAATNTSNQIFLGTGNTVTITAPTPAASSTYTVPDVGTTAAFVMTAGTQTITGNKTFSGTLTIAVFSAATLTATNTTNQITLGTGNTVTITAPSPAASSTYTIPDVGTTATFVMTSGTQTVGGAKTFSSAVVITPTTNQIVMGTGTTVTITAPTPAANNTYTIPDVGTTATFVMTVGAQTIGGTKTFSSAVAITPTTNQITLGTGTTTTISAAAPAANSIYTIPDVGTTATFVMTAGSQTIGGAKTFSSAISITTASNQLILGAVNTATISADVRAAASVYTVPDVGATGAFVITTGAQTITGTKTFSTVNITTANITTAVITTFSTANLSATATSNQLTLGTGTTVIITAPSPAVNVVYTIPDVGANTSFIMGAGSQTIGGSKTFSSAVAITPTTNQIILGAGTTTTINAAAPAASSIYTIPDVGTTANFIMSAGAQTVAGAKTFSSAVTITPTTNQITMGTGTTTTISAAAPASNSTYTIPDVGTTGAFVMTTGTQTITGTKTFSTVNITTAVITTFSSAVLSATATSNQLVLGTGNTVTITAPTPAANNTYTIPDVGTTATFVMSAGAQTVAGAKTFSSAVVITPTANQIVMGTGTTTTISATAPAANSTYSIPDVGTTGAFVMTTGAQTITGVKTFGTMIATEITTTTILTANIDITDTTNQINLGTGTIVTINVPSPAANRVYTVPDVSANAEFLMSEGNQNISGIKTFNSIVVTSATIVSATIVSLSLNVLNITSAANQIVLGTGVNTTISAPAPAVSRTVTIPTGGAASFIMTSTAAGTQTITDTIQSGNFDATFGDGTDGDITINGTTTNLVSDMYYDNLTITNGGILNTNCFRVFVRNTLTMNNTSFIRCNGGNGSGLTGGTSPSTGPMGAGSAGGAGRNTAGVGTASTARNPGVGGAGGTGGTGGANAGGAGGAITQPAANVGGGKVFRNIVNATLGRTTANVQVLGGSGGGGGGATLNTGTATSGGGGGAGSILFVAARRTVIDGTSFLQANGGNGAAAAITGTGVAGGGGGGAGGFAIFVSNANYTSNLQANGGTGGAGAGGGAAGANGSGGSVCMLINQV